MVYIFIGFLSLIALFVLPFGVGTNSFFSLAYKQAGGHLYFGRYIINFSIKAGEDGLEVKGLKIFDNFLKNKRLKKNVKKISKSIKINPTIISQIIFDKVNISFAYGNIDDAFKTSMVCESVNALVDTLYNVFSARIIEFDKAIYPVYKKNYFFLQANISFKVNFLIIFSIFLKIIIVKFRKKIMYGR